MLWNQRPVCRGLADQFALDWLSSLPWTACPVWSEKRSWPRVYDDYRCGAYPNAHMNRTHELLVLLAQRLTDDERAVLLNGQGNPFARPFR